MNDELNNELINEADEIQEEAKAFDPEEIEDDFFDDFDDESEKVGFLGKVKNGVKSGISKCKDGIEFAKENPDVAAEIGEAVAAVGALIGLTAWTAHGIKKAERTTYSEDIGETVELKRKLKNNDKTELDFRVKAGQTKIEALNDMGLIKGKK